MRNDTLFAFAFMILSAFALTGLCAGEKKISFYAERMSGTSGKKDSVTTLEGNASVTVGTLTIAGDRIVLSGKDFRFVKAEGNVKGRDDEKEFSFTADQLSYDRESEVAAFQGNAVLLDAKNEVESSAGLISYNQQTEVAFFQVDVKLKRRNIECSSDFALYRRDLSTLDLTGSPTVVRSGDEFSADRISVNLDTEYISLDGSVSGKLKDTQETKDKPVDGDTTSPEPENGGKETSE